jgi:hypothetical protein
MKANGWLMSEVRQRRACTVTKIWSDFGSGKYWRTTRRSRSHDAGGKQTVVDIAGLNLVRDCHLGAFWAVSRQYGVQSKCL